MKDVGLIQPSGDWDSLLSNSLLQDYLQFKPAEEEKLLKTLHLLNNEQWITFDCVLQSVLSDQKQTFLVVSAAGAGKTYFYNTLCHAVCSHSQVVLCVAYSGIAGQLLPSG
jgi:primosomal protein N'